MIIIIDENYHKLKSSFTQWTKHNKAIQFVQPCYSLVQSSDQGYNPAKVYFLMIRGGLKQEFLQICRNSYALRSLRATSKNIPAL
jgi:hypothetical protein